MNKLDKYLLNIEWRNINIKDIKTNYIVSNTGLVKNLKTGIILEPFQDKDGYLTVGVYVESIRHHKYVHRLVAEAFIPNPENKPQVNHIDGNKLNNNLSNLEWMTGKENIKHAIENGLRKNVTALNGAYHIHSIDKIHKICKLLEENSLSQKEIAIMFNISPSLVSEIKCKRKWLSVSSQYNINYTPIGTDYHHNAVYTEYQIEEVCRLLENNNISSKEISLKTGVRKSTISGIRHKKVWKHISDKYNIPTSPLKLYIGEKHHSTKYSNEQIHEVCRLLQEKSKTYKEIEKLTGVQKTAIWYIKKKMRRVDISSQYII